MKQTEAARRRLTLAACMLVTLVLGSVHGFSVLLVPLQKALATWVNQFRIKGDMRLAIDIDPQSFF